MVGEIVTTSLPEGETNSSVLDLSWLECDFDDVHIDGVHCPGDRDPYQCWPPTPANTTVIQKCPTGDVFLAFRHCTEDGEWQDGNWTNYTLCVLDILRTTTPSVDGNGDSKVWLAMVLRDIYFIASIISLAFLLLTLVIFSAFKSLQCTRISIHKNLVLSFIARFILVITMFEPYVSGRQSSYRDVDWLCKLLTSLSYYTILANFAWMFVEGLFLHNRLAVSVLSTEGPFTLFYLLGWGAPALVTLAWAIPMVVTYKEQCWNEHSQSPLIFIIFAPILVALVVNCAFLVNIIRILITKLRANNTIETARIRKTIKATVVLLPLLGITNLMFLLKPDSDGALRTAYRIINAVLPSCQGIFVSLLYCFLNSEVRSVIKKKWYRFRLNRAINARARRRSSRTSTFFLSQTENGQGVPLNRPKKNSSPTSQV